MSVYSKLLNASFKGVWFRCDLKKKNLWIAQNQIVKEGECNKDIPFIESDDLTNVMDIIDFECTEEEIKMLSKQFALRDVLLGLGETISFDELANKVGVSFEEIEDVLIDGDNFGMFKVKINYEKKTIRKLFVKKSSYSKEEIETLNKTINSMKGKIAFIIKALESI